MEEAVGVAQVWVQGSGRVVGVACVHVGVGVVWGGRHSGLVTFWHMLYQLIKFGTCALRTFFQNGNHMSLP